MRTRGPHLQLVDLPPRIRSVVEEVAAEYEVAAREIMSDRRPRPVVTARHEVWRRLHKLQDASGAPLSTTRISKWFGCDHSTVVQAETKRRKTAEVVS